MGLFNINIYANDRKLIELLKSCNLKLDNIMATIQDLTAQVDELQAALDAEQQQIADAIAALQQTITDLQEMVADGGTAEERQALSDKLTAIKADLEATVNNEPPQGE